MSSETSRIEAFSDGVFSIAATLLVLDLKAPPASLPFWLGVAHQWPGYCSFVLSFLFIGIMWINHHRLFSHIRRADDALMVVNLLLLLGVVTIPYPTTLIAQSLNNGRLQDAAILYNASYLALSLLFNLLLATCVRRGLVDSEYAHLQTVGRRYITGPLVYSICLAMSWWSVPVSLVINAAMAVYFLLPHRFADPAAAASRVGSREH